VFLCLNDIGEEKRGEEREKGKGVGPTNSWNLSGRKEGCYSYGFEGWIWEPTQNRRHAGVDFLVEPPKK
jgi:hypothetical protein